MASATRPDNQTNIPSPLLPTPTAPQLAVVPPKKAQLQQTFEEYGGRTGRILGATGQFVSGMYDEVRTRAARGYGRVRYRGREFASRAGERAKQIKRERPLQILAVIAATAFTAGFLIRIWRSRNS